MSEVMREVSAGTRRALRSRTTKRATSVSRANARAPRAQVDTARVAAVGQAVGVLLTETVRSSGLTTALSTALAPWAKDGAIHDPGKILTDLAVTLVLGGDTMSDLGVLRSEPGVYGRRRRLGDTGQMTPQEALAEIAFRLERNRAEPFRIQAFRRAATAIADLGEDDLRTRAADGRLGRTKGIGGRSLEVITQALGGGTPDYLQHLRDEAEGPSSEPGRVLLALLRGDLHTHSEWSDGTTPIESMVEAARILGREYLALTDHSPNLKVANGLTAERLADQLDVVAALDDPAMRLLPGIEVDVLQDGTLDQEPALLDRLDVVVASLHSRLRADRAEVTARLLGAIADPHTSVIGHITGRLVEGRRGTRPQSEFDSARVFAAAAEAGVAIEINSRPERQDPPDDLLAEAIAAGCLFSIDTDAHAPGHLDLLGLGAERAAAAGVPPARIVTTWPIDQLLTWTHARR